MAEAPAHFETINRDVFVEPLGGPEHMERLLESFPDNLYNKSPSSRFYKFVYALMGPSGIGQLVKNYFEARLILLEQNVELFDIERFYWNPFQFGRIFEEQTFEDIDSSLMPADWEKIKAQDASYRSRALDFIGAARLGTSPQGMRLAAKSGLGSEVTIFERYNWLFDQLSDQPIGVKDYGQTLSLNEFVVLPRATEGRTEVQQLRFESTVFEGEYALEFLGHQTDLISFDADAFDIQSELRALPSVGPNEINVTGGKAPLPFTITFAGNFDNTNIDPIVVRQSSLRDGNGKSSNAQVVTIEEGSRPIDKKANVPARIMHNMQTALERLKPVNSLFTFEPSQGTVLNRDYEIQASSTYLEPVRFVTGSPKINWPPVDDKFWIESGVERPAKRFYQEDSAHYVNFHAIQSVSVEEDGLTNADLMVDPNPEFKSVINGYVNGIYPVEYFGVSGTSDLDKAETYWESLERAYPNSETIEVRLATAQPTNFLSFNISDQPVEIFFEYCLWENGSERHYIEAVSADKSFSGFISGNESNQWHYIEYFFVDSNQSIPITNSIKIHLNRLDDRPLSREFSIAIKDLKVGRSVIL